MMVELKEGERIDSLQRNGYEIIQDPKRFCFGMDAVLLTAFAAEGIKPNETVLDIGTGTGVIPILLEAKTQAAHFTGLEIQSESADMARRSVMLNGLTEKIEIVTGDILEADAYFAAASFSAITCNPPYMPAFHGIKNPDAPKAIARHEIKCTLLDIIRHSARLLKPGGKLYMVHKPERLAEIMTIMSENKIEPKRLRLVYPTPQKEPSMILIEGARGGNRGMKVEAPLIVYAADGKYTKEVSDLYER